VDNLQLNLDRAIQLLNTPANYEDYLSIKIKPVNDECCCYDHWRETWNHFNEYIYPSGPLENEGAILIERENERYVLECHESGPEIIAYLQFGTAVVGLITTLLKFRQLENRHFSLKFILTIRHLIKNKIDEEKSIEIDLSISDEAIKKKIGSYTKNTRMKKPKRKI